MTPPPAAPEYTWSADEASGEARFTIHRGRNRVVAVLTHCDPKFAQLVTGLLIANAEGEVDNAGCDECGSYDRIAGSNLCAGCLAGDSRKAPRGPRSPLLTGRATRAACEMDLQRLEAILEADGPKAFLQAVVTAAMTGRFPDSPNERRGESTVH